MNRYPSSVQDGILHDLLVASVGRYSRTQDIHSRIQVTYHPAKYFNLLSKESLPVTLIAIYHDPKNGVLAFADTLISASDYRLGDQNYLPLQFGFGNSFGTYAVRCASKAVLFGDYIVLWAGRVDAARSLIRKFKEAVDPSIDDFRRIIDANPGLSQEVQLIYGCNNGDICWHTDWRCKRDLDHGCELIAGGTGDDDYIEGSSIQKGYIPLSQGDRGKSSWDHFFLKLGELIQLELTSFTHKWSVYGGAYEIFTVQEGGRGFRRVNYALTEVSNRLHVEQKWSDLMEAPSRLIQFVGKEDRSICLVMLFSPEGRNQTKVFEILDIMQDQASHSMQLDFIDLTPELSFAYVMGTGFHWRFDPDTHYAYFAPNKTKDNITVVTNKGALQRLVQKYYDGGFGIIPGSSGFDPWSDQEQ